ncbi:hypothetical protein Dimus_037634 [Dionaea muscipula]
MPKNLASDWFAGKALLPVGKVSHSNIVFHASCQSRSQDQCYQELTLTWMQGKGLEIDCQVLLEKTWIGVRPELLRSRSVGKKGKRISNSTFRTIKSPVEDLDMAVATIL